MEGDEARGQIDCDEECVPAQYVRAPGPWANHGLSGLQFPVCKRER